MSKNLRRRTAAAMLAASVGLLGAVEAQAAGARRADRLTAPRVPVENQLQDFARILWMGAAGAVADLLSAPAGTHNGHHNPPGQGDDGSDGPGLDPDGRDNGNNRNGNNRKK